MDLINGWGRVLGNSFVIILEKTLEVLPALIIAIAVFIAGLFIAEGLGRVVQRLLKSVLLDQAMDRLGFKQTMERVGIKIEISRALGLLITWFLYAVTLVAAADILGLTQISAFLRDVVLYIPNVIIAIVILIVGILISNFIYTLIKEAATAAQIKAAHLLADIGKWAILIFSFMAALVQLGVATELIQILFTGVVAMFALAGGLAFGLGGKDHAKALLDKLTRR